MLTPNRADSSAAAAAVILVAIGVLSGFWGPTNDATASVEIHDARTETLIWHFNHEITGGVGSSYTRLVEQLATYDHADVDANLDAVVAESTPGFAERYSEVSEGLRELLTSGQGTSAGTVTHAAVESVDGDSAVVLVFLDQLVTNVTVPDGRTDASRMVVTLQRDGDRWLLDNAELA